MMNKQINTILVLGLLFISMLGVSNAAAAIPVPMPMVIEEKMVDFDIYNSDIEFSKLQIKPS